MSRPQFGGSHYKLPIGPIDYILANELGYCEGNVLKYITRWQAKDGVKDLRKAAQYIDFLIKDATAHPEKYGLPGSEDAGSPTLDGDA